MDGEGCASILFATSSTLNLRRAFFPVRTSIVRLEPYNSVIRKLAANGEKKLPSPRHTKFAVVYTHQNAHQQGSRTVPFTHTTKMSHRQRPHRMEDSHGP